MPAAPHALPRTTIRVVLQADLPTSPHHFRRALAGPTARGPTGLSPRVAPLSVPPTESLSLPQLAASTFDAAFIEETCNLN
ncbi:hypothetical protein H257_07047 [Aphanomyces astaci]|uniref:Uncharacterized protein n=1 Tax=Aphanomyces astaci TaxID=112090 RepID=W4GKF1_APHAT|nr:hypothetical protein H257_07047 [Aphanomyces astaci]ETV79831.1 hypothetical protein H257_07047 [Aphanomyces astaci]|eukprot:XP_009830767.1 hypothetical protein H257_07047 [Aphanomyces astaci]